MAEKWSAHWAHLFDEVVTSGLCTGCAGCVVACPYDVLGYNDAEGVYKPFHLETDNGPGDCSHGEKGCTYCTRACPRFRNWEVEIDTHMFGRPRKVEEVDGVSRTSSWPRRSTPRSIRRARTAASSPPSFSGRWTTATSTPPSSPISKATGRHGRPSPAWPAPAKRSSPPPAAATRIRPTPWP